MNNKIINNRSAFGGAMIIAGTAIGAGMLALPIATSGMWYFWGIIGILFTWFCMYTSGLFILEANLHYPAGAHLDTIAKDCLHPILRFINSAALLFVLYILTYAYITIGSPFLSDFVSSIVSLNSKVAMLLYIAILGTFVTISTKLVDRVTTIILGAMVLTFLFVLPNLLRGVQIESLLNTEQVNPEYFPYIFGGIASVVAAFGYHGNVSSLVKYYEKDYKKVKSSLFFGTLITVTIYILWLTGAFGNISRAFFHEHILTAKNESIELVRYLNQGTLLTLFSNFAILSSFLGVTLGLFDYIADALKFDDSMSGRTKTALVTYFPPTFFAILYPYGFVVAIGFAGLCATVWALIIPALMARATRKKYKKLGFQVYGGNLLIYLIIAFGLIVALSEILALLEILPKYR